VNASYEEYGFPMIYNFQRKTNGCMFRVSLSSKKLKNVRRKSYTR